MAEGKLLILPDGRIMAHTITPALAEVLETVSLDESLVRYRAHLVDRQERKTARRDASPYQKTRIFKGRAKPLAEPGAFFNSLSENEPLNAGE